MEEYSNFFDRKSKQHKFSYLILVVINGTTDNTERVVKDSQKRYKNIRYLNFERGGKGFAITEGFRHSLKNKFDLVGFVDADLTTSPEEYWKLVQSIKDNDRIDGAIADRYLKGAKIVPAFSFRRLIVSRIFNFLVRVIFNLKYDDTQCGAKLFKGEAVEKILDDLTLTQWAYDVNLLYSCKKKNLRIKSVPTFWREAKGSKLNINKASIQMIFSIIQLRLIKSPFKDSLKVLNPIIEIIYKAVK